MKGLGANRSRHMSDSCEPARCPQKPLYPLTSDPHSSFLLSPTINHYGTLDPHLHLCTPTSPTNLTPDCLLPFSQLSNSSTFPRLHFTSQTEQVDCSQACMAGGGGLGQGGRTGALSNSLSMGMGLGLGLTGAPMITSGSATISSAAAAKMNRLPSNLLDQLERHLPLQRDGFSTLQFHRGRMSKQRSESPGRIRHLMHSVQKLFAKSQSLENSAIKGNMNGRSAGGTAGTTGAGEDGGRPTRRSKSKDRAKTEGPKQRPRPNALGFWSSDDALDTDTTKAGTIAVGYRNPLTMMSLGRAVSDSQAAPRHIPQGYHTISAHTLKTSKSSSDLKFLACQATQVVSKDEEGRIRGSKDDILVKRGSWSTLTLSQARQVLQKGSATVNRTLLKSKSCHQDLAQQFLQVPLGDWAGTLGRGRGRGTEIPCRRMRSGSYVKAMGDLEDSEDSEGSPKHSPKATARRQSYLRATQHSLSEQQPPPPPQRKPRCYALMREDYLWSPLQSACSMQHLSSLPSLKELSTNRSLDNLDCLVSPLEAPPRYRNNDFSQCSATLGRGSAAQRVSLHTFFQVYGQGCGHSLPYCEGESQAVEALDLPAPTCFRSRSHSYLRAIQAGCSQDEDTSVDSDSPPPTTAAGYSYSSNTIGSRKAPPPVPPRTTSKPLISVTVQSSTESAQDVYTDQQDRGSEANSQSGRSNSSDSLCSIRTGSLAKGPRPLPVPVPVLVPVLILGPAAGSVHPVPAPRDLPPPTTTTAVTTTSTSTQSQHDTLSFGFTLEPAPTATKRKLSSIGIQVDCILPVLREEPLPLPAPLKFQSIGVQVENGRPLSRESSMASRQNTETEPQEPQDAAPTENNTANCTNSQTSNATAPNGQDKAMEQQLLKRTSAASRISSPPQVTLDPALDPSSLPPPDPSLESGNCSAHGDAIQPGTPACLRDGNWFMKLLQAETGRMEGWCQQMEQETKDNKLSEEVLGTIRSAVGSAQLLMTKKFEQFRGLCNENLDVSANPRPTAQDLAGFWDLLQLSIEDISMKFDELYQLKANKWQLPEKSEKDENKQLPSVPKKQTKPRLSAGKDRSVDSVVDKQRQEARKRLMAAKRAASVRQNSATESADSIEIYVPEAQTRL
ncbi:disks large-associated protein 4 isoform X1 [Anarrhichthys ocellatus]|uniref:disks large-associated protein 4 isoform X1 n=1 Tax=Anarrhichthys ocellatus TaxID=433405 RepID=UPI0012EEBBF0|nr:disks large-associated protein 4-like isoform X1 [Anarrhichthys ocellatus]XP_031700198.1 disks large-associated protein 4-like isoform X1 [Anarrhichthys ocellatus]